MRPLCVVPARRGSKRLAEKNILALAGRPMLGWTIDAALESGVFDAVYVSSEDAEIRELAASLGARAHARPKELAGDLVSATDVCLEVWETLGEGHEAIVCLQPTSPLRTGEDVVASWQVFEGSGADFLVSTTPIDPHYFHWALRREGDWSQMWFGDEFMLERPLLPPVDRPNGAIKIGRAEPLLARRDFFGPRLTTYDMPPERSVHVAERVDLALAELLLTAQLR